jgi:replicative DNA helicase
MSEPVYPIESADHTAAALRLPPHSIEAEQAVLGGLLLDNSTWDQIADRIADTDFYRRDHRTVFSAIRLIIEDGRPCDVVTLCEWLESRGSLDEVGGLPYLGGLVRDTPSAANIRAYADIVRERAILRGLIRVGTEIANSAYQTEGRGSKELLDQAEQRVFEIAERGARAGQSFTVIGTLASGAAERIDTLSRLNSSVTGIATGFERFDEMTAGLQPGDLIVVAGRPSMGKTSFAMNCAEHAVLKYRLPVAVFSMEMSGEQIAMRLISSLGRLDQQKVRTGKLDDEDWPRVSSTLTLLGDVPLYIDDSPALTPSELRARARRLKREHHDLGLIVVDYLQLMQVPGTRENRATEISEISRGMKALAKELHVPVVALSQLNRSLEQRPNKRPVMSDLRESGAIEQDADVIVFIYRDEVYNEDSPQKGTAEIIIGKQRNGPTGTVHLAFLNKYTRFENLASGDYRVEGFQ